MSELPRGTVTFLFTDIEGSTKLWQQFPSAMPAALARHHEILRDAIEAHKGYVFQIIGDAFCAAFETALDGLDAALDAQRALRDFAWGETGAIRVRMALHTGAAEVRAGEFTSGEYVSGITLSRAARLLGAGHGGQILLSEPTEVLIQEQSFSTTTLRDMGAHRLKDLVQPIQIFQVLAPDLPQDFPRLKTLDALPNNLPIQLTSFIGREREVGEIKSLWQKARVLTLMGAGGSGKTRLSLQVAADLVDEFEKGAWFVDLSPITDPVLVPNAVLDALELRADATTIPLNALTDYLRAKKLLLVLDNCEHLIEACARFAQHLLIHCADLKILATSREALGIAGEVTYQVPTLALPDPSLWLRASSGQPPSLETLSQYDAVKLFIERAVAVQPNFAVTNANAPAIAQICFRLDGIPLALELAAARIKLFSPEQIAARLDDRFRLLASGSRTALPRQQTLRGAIDWSFSLLSEQERVLFRRLSIFVGGWTFEAAEQVCAGNEIDTFDVLEQLAELVNKSLVITELHRDETRYRMLETIREYAFEKLRAANETDALRDKHLDYFVAFAEQAEPQLKRAQQEEWLERLDADADNFRAALDRSLGDGRSQNGLRLATALARYWEMRSNRKEGIQHLEAVLKHPEGATKSIAWANALCALGLLKGTQGDEDYTKYFVPANEIAKSYGAEGKRVFALSLFMIGSSSSHDDNPGLQETLENQALQIAENIKDDWLLGLLRYYKGWSFLTRQNVTAAREMFKASLASFRACGDPYWIDEASIELNQLLLREGNFAPTRKELESRLPTLRQSGHRWKLASRLNMLGEIARGENNYGSARTYYAEALEIARDLGGKNLWEAVCINLGYVALYDGELESAETLFKEGFALALSYQNRGSKEMNLMAVASLNASKAKAFDAVRLFSAGDSLIRSVPQAVMSLIDEAEYERYLALARKQLSEQEFNSAWEAGRALTLEQAIELALQQGDGG